VQALTFVVLYKHGLLLQSSCMFL